MQKTLKMKYASFGMFLCIFFSSAMCSNRSSQEIEKITPLDSPQLPSRGFFMGVLPTPAWGQTFDDSYAQAAQHVEFVPVWGRPSPFYSLADDLSGEWGFTFVQKLIRNNKMFPIIHLSFIGNSFTLVTPPGLENATLSNIQWQEAYRKAAIDVVRTSKPLYLSIGNEVNRWYEKFGLEGENGFIHFIRLYESIYDEIKKICPEIQIFCTFAREIVAENREASLEVLTYFNPNKMDILVFTSYPYAVKGINSPSKIRNSYYREAANYLPGKPFGFSEIAWSSHSYFGGESEQSNFLVQVLGRLTKEQGIVVQFLGWCWLHDIDESDTVGLLKIDGTARIIYNTWKNISAK
ncbi:MAG: hypothetical protein N2316_06855 [Spirochaetes bacterium]|nr:hypothetical protein [Spirochaetota bacterium]